MKRPLRVASFILLLPVGLACLYLGVVNGVLNLGLGQRLLNSHPERVRITYDRVWSLWPGRIHTRKVHISGQDARVQFEITADEAMMDFSPRGLSARVVTGHRLHGRGASVRIRTRLQALPTPAELAELPPIRDLPSPMRAPGPFVPPDIGVRLEDIDVHEVREVWVDGYHFVGDVDVKGGLYFKPDQALRVYPATLVVRRGTLDAPGGRAVADVHGTVEATVDEVDLRDADLSTLSRVSARLALDARVQNIRFLNYYLTRAPQIRLDDGAGDVTLKLVVDHGMLTPGGAVEVRSPRMVLVLPYFDAIGSGHVLFEVKAGVHDHTDIAVELGGVSIVQRSDHRAVLAGKTIRVHGHTSDLNLANPPELELTVDLPDASGADLSFLNVYVPDAIPMTILGGSGTLDAHLGIKTAEHHIDGVADLRGKRLAVQNYTARLRGAAHVHGVLRSLDWISLRTDLSGSYLTLDNVTITLDGKDTPDWWARVELPACVVHPKGRIRMAGVVKLRLKNLKPVMGVVSENVDLPWIVKALADRQDLRAQADLKAGATTLDVTGIKVSTGALAAIGQLHFSELQRQHPGAEGILLLTWRALAVALEIHGPRTHAIVVTPTKWFEARTATLASAAAPTARR